MKRLGILLIALTFMGIVACEGLLDDANTGLTEEEVADGLRTALIVGADTSVATLHANNGYLADMAVKIFLPTEAKPILDAANSSTARSLGLDVVLNNLIEDVITRMNHAAENAAIEAKPILTTAVSRLSLTQAWDILKGVNPLNPNKSAGFDSTAATNYLRFATYDSLKFVFSDDIDLALDKDLAGGVSTNEAWGELASYYNQVAPLLGGKTVDAKLGSHVTGKALDGLFYKVGMAEKEIRRDPLAWAEKWGENILKIVFGSSEAKNP